MFWFLKTESLAQTLCLSSTAILYDTLVVSKAIRIISELGVFSVCNTDALVGVCIGVTEFLFEVRASSVRGLNLKRESLTH